MTGPFSGQTRQVPVQGRLPVWDGHGFLQDRADRQAAFDELYQASDEAQAVLENYVSEHNVRSDSFEAANAAIQASTGVQLPNPMRFVRDPMNPDSMAAPDPMDEWYRRRHELMDQFPQSAGAIRAVDPLAEQLRTTHGAVARRDEATASEHLNGADRFAASTMGAMRGMMRDPLVVASMVVGGGAGTARTALARVFQVAATEAAINAGVESALAMQAMEWKRANGLEATWQEAAVQVGTAGALGFMFGGVFQSGAEVLHAYGRTAPDAIPALDRIIAGRTQSGDLEHALSALGAELDDDTLAMIAEAEDVLADELAIDASRDQVTAAHADEELQAPQEAVQGQMVEAIRRVENPDEPRPAAVYARPAPHDGVEAMARADTLAEAPTSVAGRPVTRATLDPARLETDAVAYQYKSDSDDAGLTDRLGSVQRWDDTLAGVLFVHRRADGDFVADGHQRAGLARRASEAGQDVRVPAMVLDEADGWTIADVRALAARKNMAEGSGTALDAARVLRDRPDLLDEAMPVTSPVMQKAEGLARLHDDAWSMTANGLVNEDFAALVGRRVEDPTLHAPVLEAMLREPPSTQREANLLIDELLDVPRLAETVRAQGSLFTDDAALTVMGQRVQVLDRALVFLRQDRAVFKKLMDNADVIERAGNVLDEGANAARVDTAAYLDTMLTKLARRTGSPVSDALNRAASTYAESGKKNAAEFARAFVDDVAELVNARGLDELLADPHAVPDLPEPFTPERATQAGEAAELLRQAEPNDDDDLFGAILRGYDENGDPIMGRASDMLDDADQIDIEADVITHCRAQVPGLQAGA